ncbi:ANK [Aspergillus sclerotialis]|uniref:ANK n=1 Tax=Aspergillus sclerotialis TaxID=2070753 RepID=A0A3A2ZY36_9EURO|nr:ANK [Aspergillus sclerotialis]
MSYNTLPPESLLIIANFLDTDDQLSWILTERRAFGLKSKETYTRAIAEDEAQGWPEHLIRAADTGRLETFKDFYIPHESEYYNRYGSVLHYLCHKGNEEAILLMAKDPRVNLSTRDGEGWTPLHLVAHSGLESIVRIFCSFGVHVDERVKPHPHERWYYSSSTAIHLAVMKDHRSVIEFLIKAGASLSEEQVYYSRARPESGIDCLGLAAKYANHDLVKYFLSRKHFERESMAHALLKALVKTCWCHSYAQKLGIKLVIYECDLWEPLTEDRFATIQLLLDAVADVSACCPYGVPILNHTRSVEMARILLDAAKNNKNKAASHPQERVSPVDYLILRYEELGSSFWDRIQLALLYIEHGFKILYNASAGWNAFYKAIERGYLPVISAMLERQESLIHS